jgi:hypothetical protein
MAHIPTAFDKLNSCPRGCSWNAGDALPVPVPMSNTFYVQNQHPRQVTGILVGSLEYANLDIFAQRSHVQFAPECEGAAMVASRLVSRDITSWSDVDLRT